MPSTPTVPSPTSYKYASLFGLVVIQTVVGSVYKFSQVGGKYEFNTAAAIVLAETTKFCISFGVHLWGHKWDRQTALEQMKSEISGRKLASIAVLALLYATNNTIQFIAN